MPHSNRNKLSRLFGTFCHLWTKGLHANVQMKTTGSGGVVAQFEFQLDKPHKSFPAGLPGFRRSQPQRVPRHHEPGSPHAPGHPGAVEGSRRRPRRRGPKAIERSRLRAAAHQASLAAARCSAPTTAIPMPPPAPPPPPFGPTSTRLIKVVPRRTSHRSSFSQVDGQDNSVGDNDCSATVSDEGVPPTASSAPLQPPPTQTPPTNGAEFKSPVGVTEVKAKAAAEVKQAPAVYTPERHYRPLERAREKHRLRCAVRCVLCNHEFSDLEWSKAGWATEEMSVICKTCEDLMRAGSKHRAKIPNPAD